MCTAPVDTQYTHSQRVALICCAAVRPVDLDMHKADFAVWRDRGAGRLRSREGTGHAGQVGRGQCGAVREACRS